jgi:hypothetical protein
MGYRAKNPMCHPAAFGQLRNTGYLISGSSVMQLLTKKNPAVENEDSAPSPKSLSSAVLYVSLM